jgi:hypothetical protein
VPSRVWPESSVVLAASRTIAVVCELLGCSIGIIAFMPLAVCRVVGKGVA